MNKYCLLTILFLSLFGLALSCKRTYSIEEQARKQVVSSFKLEVESFERNTSNIAINDLKTVYVNDSICILQFLGIYSDSLRHDVCNEIQYVYYFDRMLSNFYGKFVFLEEFRLVPLYTDEEIKQNVLKVKRNHENVYSSFQGYGNIVKENPVDE